MIRFGDRESHKHYAMPGGIDSPALGYAAFCGIKFVGYSLFAGSLYNSYSRRSVVDNAIFLTRDGHVATNIECSQCGYNLRTLAEDAVCPECATAVADSLADPIREMPTKWAANAMAVGATRTLIGIVFGAMLFLIL